MVMNDRKIYQKMINKNWLRTEKILQNEKICLIRNYFHLEKLFFSWSEENRFIRPIQNIFFWTEIQFFQASTEKKFTLAFEKFFK